MLKDPSSKSEVRFGRVWTRVCTYVLGVLRISHIAFCRVDAMANLTHTRTHTHIHIYIYIYPIHSPSADKYIWDSNPQQKLQERTHILRSFRGMTGKELLQGGTIVDKHDDFEYGSTIGLGLKSHWEICFLTDETKATFFVDIKAANVTHLGVQTEFCKKEQEQMAAEDTASCEQEIFIERKERIDALYTLIAKEKEKFRHDIAPSLHAELAEYEKNKQILEQKKQQLQHNLNKWLLVRAQAIYATSKACIALRMNKDDEKAQKKERKQREKGMTYVACCT